MHTFVSSYYLQVLELHHRKHGKKTIARLLGEWGQRHRHFHLEDLTSPQIFEELLNGQDLDAVLSESSASQIHAKSTL
jgi:hypothetical protein